MIEERIKEEFNNSSDLIIKKIKKLTIIYLESISSSDKVNDYITLITSMDNNKIRDVFDNMAAPNIKLVKELDQCEFYLTNGFTLVIKGKKVYAIETRADIHRSVNVPQTQQSINGPKDAFTENIQINLGLIKRRIKSSHLINDDFIIGRKTNTKVSVLYLEDICDSLLVRKIEDKLKEIDIDGILDSSVIAQFLTGNAKTPFPTAVESERPDRVASDLLEGKVAIIVDTSPFVIILPAFFFDFINPQSDDYNKSININFVKMIRAACLLITLLAPALYVALINYNQETIPLSLLINFSQQRDGVPFPAAIEAFLMLLMVEILRESDIRFPSSYGSSVSILGALILGDAAVSAGIVSPIMIIVVAITFITSLIFTEMEMINSLRIFRFLFLIAAAFAGLFGIVLAGFIFLIHLCSIETFNTPYTYPLAPFDKVYAEKILMKKEVRKNKWRSKLLARKNKRKLGENL